MAHASVHAPSVPNVATPNLIQPACHHCSRIRTASLHNKHSRQQRPIPMSHHDISTGTEKLASHRKPCSGDGRVKWAHASVRRPSDVRHAHGVMSWRDVRSVFFLFFCTWQSRRNHLTRVPQQVNVNVNNLLRLRMTGTTSRGGKPPGNPPQTTARNSQGCLLC